MKAHLLSFTTFCFVGCVYFDDRCEQVGPGCSFGQIIKTYHVHGRSTKGGSHDPVLQEPGEPEVCDLESDVLWGGVPAAALVRQQDVLRLQVPVHDPLAVHRNHRPG